MADNSVSSESGDAQKAAGDEICEINGEESLDFEDFEEEIRELICPKETERVTLSRTIPGDVEQIQADEILALKAIFEDDLRMVDESTAKYFKIKINPIAEKCRKDEVVDLWFCLPSQYPAIPPIFEVEGHGSLSSAKADKLYSILMEEACSRLNSLMIYDLITVAQEFVQKTMAEIRERRMKEEPSLDNESKLPESTISKDNEEPLYDMHYKNHGNVDLRDAQKYIGHIHNVLMKVPDHLKVQSLENIMKHKLVKRFNTAWERISEKYKIESRKYPGDFITSPRVAFHGTRQGNVPRIVRNGLVVPGLENRVQVANGSSLGVGIYLSPQPEYSFGYCDTGGKVLVCAVLPGHVYNVGENARFPSRKYDCITCGDEMVIFDARRVLPCYVITLVPKESKISVDENTSNTLEKARETKYKRLQGVAARAKEFVTYGFGHGDRFQIRDAADSDDDEDEDGIYQNERYHGCKDYYDDYDDYGDYDDGH